MPRSHFEIAVELSRRHRDWSKIDIAQAMLTLGCRGFAGSIREWEVAVKNTISNEVTATTQEVPPCRISTR